ncbi:MAG TPA: Gfo/Idh/MocA family oxidoreductase [Nitrospirota bacterium]|nr:Gfo/Idh/MocA family oxidoreductase [Nitrospirota bacterium]
MKKVRVGVIGVGYLGQFHAEKYAAMPDTELKGVVDTDQVRAKQIAKKLNTLAFSDPAQLLGQVDAVSIVVPTVFHHQIAKQFLKQGIHVLLEKPVTATLEQADELIELAAGKKLVLQVGHIERFNPAVTAVKPLLKTPRYMTAERSAPFTVRCTDVNVILDLMIHDLDIVMDLAGSAPYEVSAAGASVITREIDCASARLVFQNGCVADVTASRVSEEKKRLLRVYDGEALYTSDYQSQKAIVSRKGGDPVPELVMNDISTERRDTLDEEVRAFVLSIETGTHPLVSGIEGRRALALAQKITENIQKGITEFVPVA